MSAPPRAAPPGLRGVGSGSGGGRSSSSSYAGPSGSGSAGPRDTSASGRTAAAALKHTRVLLDALFHSSLPHSHSHWVVLPPHPAPSIPASAPAAAAASASSASVSSASASSSPSPSAGRAPLPPASPSLSPSPSGESSGTPSSGSTGTGTSTGPSPAASQTLTPRPGSPYARRASGSASGSGGDAAYAGAAASSSALPDTSPPGLVPSSPGYVPPLSGLAAPPLSGPLSAAAAAGQAFRPSKPSSLAASAASSSGRGASSGSGSGSGSDSDSDGDSGSKDGGAGSAGHTTEGEEDEPPPAGGEARTPRKHAHAHPRAGRQRADPPDPGRSLGAGAGAGLSRSNSSSASASAPAGGGEDPAAAVVSALQDGGLDEEQRVDAVRERLDAGIRAAIARASGAGLGAGSGSAGDALGAGLTPAQLDALVLDLLHRHREDLHPAGRAFPPPPSLALLLAHAQAGGGAGGASSSAGAGSGPTAGAPSLRPRPLQRTASSSSAASSNGGGGGGAGSRPWTPTRLGSFSSAGAGVGGPAASVSASAAAVSSALAGAAFSPLPSPAFGAHGLAGSIPGSPGSSRPGTPTRSRFGFGASANTSSANTSSVSIAADSDPIVSPAPRPSSRASASASAFAPPASPGFAPSTPSAGAGVGVIGQASPAASPRLWARGLPGASAAAASSALGSGGSPASLHAHAHAHGAGPAGAGSLYAAAVGANASTSSLGALHPNSSSSSLQIHVAMPPSAGAGAGASSASSRPTSPLPAGGASGSSSSLAKQGTGASASTASPRLNVAAIEFQPKGVRSASSSVNSSPLARHRSAAAPGAMAVPSPPWTALATSTTAVPGGSASSAGSSGGGVSAPSSLSRSLSARAAAEGASAGANEDSEESSEEDEFSPFASAAKAGASRARLGLPNRGPLDPADWYSSGNSNSAASDTGRSDEGAAEQLPPSDATMTPFDVLCSILIHDGGGGGAGDQPQWTPEQVEEALAVNNWDVAETLTMVMNNGGQPLPPQPRAPPPKLHAGPVFTPKSQDVPASSSMNPRLYFPAGPKGFARGGSSGVQVMSADAFGGVKPGSPRPTLAGQRMPSGAMTPPAGGQPAPGSVGAARVCRYYLAGECRRADCRFSHDLGRALCKYWLRGKCLNDPCSFLHDYDVLNNLASGIASSSISNGSQYGDLAPDTPPAAAEDFPSLGGMPSPGGERKPSPGWQTPPKVLDPTRTRWAQAIQRKNVPPALAAMRSGERAFVPGSARNAPTTARPAQPSPTIGAAGPSRSSASRIALRAPSLLPTLAIGHNAASAYASHRGNTQSLSDERNRALAKASAAWKRGDGEAARAFSQQGTALNARLAEESKGAAHAILQERHAELRDRLLNTGSDGGGWGAGAAASDEPGARGMRGKIVGSGLGICLGVARKEAIPQGAKLGVEERVECLLDLHGLHIIEAVEMTEEFLLGLERENLRGLAYLAVGEGRHSSAGAASGGRRLSSAVKQFLASWGYPYATVDGVLVVDPCTHLS